MSDLSDLRLTLAASLGTLAAQGVAVDPAWPDVLAPPAVFIAPPLADQWVRFGPNFGEYTVALDLVLLVDHDATGAALARVEDLVSAVLALVADDWVMNGVDAPAPTTVSEGGADYLAAVVHLSKPVRL
jgi:hypothetical protein